MATADVFPVPAPLTASQKKRAKKMRAEARKQAITEPLPAAEPSDPSSVTLDARSSTAESRQGIDIAALLAKAREAFDTEAGGIHFPQIVLNSAVCSQIDVGNWGKL
jgi:hypothetical protein